LSDSELQSDTDNDRFPEELFVLDFDQLLTSFER
jgi:hypothetical protein